MSHENSLLKRDIFPLPTDKFRLAIAKVIPVGEKNAIASRDVNALFVASGIDKKERNTKTSRIHTTLKWWSGERKTQPPVNCTVTDDNKFFWQTTNDLNTALNQESPDDMNLSKALAYSLVKEHFSNLLPPSELNLLTPYFVAADNKLQQLKQLKGDKIKASKYLPFCNQWKKEPINPDDYKAIFDAIEHKKVLRADYDSMHKGKVPKSMVFSPQQILLQYEHTQVVAYLHNPDDNIPIHRHFDINRLSNIKEENYLSYETKLQPKHRVKLVALIHPWVRDKLNFVKLSDDQIITYWEDLTPEDKEQCSKLNNFSEGNWAKVEATIELTGQFLSKHDEWDAWFFVNSIAMFGGDFIPLEPTQVVNEYNRRITDAYNSFKNLGLSEVKFEEP